MHRYIPLSDEDRREMCKVVGVESPLDLLSCIPDEVRKRFDASDMPAEGVGELGVERELQWLASRNRAVTSGPSFLGAGAYDRFVPAVVDHVLGRSEFYTAYTPYQAEVSQGTLQCIFEYQSMICSLTGMVVSNASHYDGATALAEACLIAAGAAKKDRLVVSRGVHPRRRRVLATYARAAGLHIEEVGLEAGRTVVPGQLDEAAALVVQQPNFLGVIEDLKSLGACRGKKTQLIVSADPVSLGLLESPGECGADMVVGEALGCGLPLNAGGPGLGFMAVSKKLMRRIPGRLVGRAKDVDGTDAFVLTLQAREQHIRRAQASSNICTNQALCALAATVYFSSLGATGLERLAELEFHRAHRARRLLLAAGCSAPFEAPFFNEFPVVFSRSVSEVNATLLESGIVGGYDLSSEYPELGNAMLCAVTETRTIEDIDRFAGKVGELNA